MNDGTVAINGHELVWREHSPGRHPFIFIHGYSAAITFWSREVRRFAHLGRCVTLTLPGHHPAAAPPDFSTLDQDTFIDLIAEGVRQIAGDQPATLVGHSAGGLAALGVAARLGDQIQRVVSVTGVVWGPLIGSLGALQQLLRRRGYPLYWLAYRLTQRIRPLLIPAIANFYTHNRRATRNSPVARAAADAWYPNYQQAAPRSFSTLLRMLEHVDLRPLIAGMPTPVLAITGGDDPVVPAEQSRWLAANLPHCDLRVLPGVGHLPQWEAPDAFDALVEDWLVRHDQPSPSAAISPND